MIKKLMPVILLVFGTGAGVGAGLFLRPAESHEADPAAMSSDTEATTSSIEAKPAQTKEPEGPIDREYVEMSNQFVVPIVDKEAVRALVVLALSIEVQIGQQEIIFQREPKLRDSFLQVLFDHANSGGFEGEFTSNDNMRALRQALREVAIKDMGDMITDVLISDIARQDY